MNVKTSVKSYIFIMVKFTNEQRLQIIESYYRNSESVVATLISRNGPVKWPPRSCDLRPFNFLLWGHAQSLVYANKPRTLEELRNNIEREIANVSADMCGKVVENEKLAPKNRWLPSCSRWPYERDRIPYLNVTCVLHLE